MGDGLTTATGKRRWLAPLAVGFALVAVAGLGVSALMFARWSDLQVVTAAEASVAFADTLSELGGDPPYLEVSPGGEVSVRRELEKPMRHRLRALHVLAWEPRGGRLVRVDFPFWFVRVKMTRAINLGTLTSALAGDWQNLDLRVSADDLARRGPGLILDETFADGRRILLWTE